VSAFLNNDRQLWAHSGNIFLNSSMAAMAEEQPFAAIALTVSNGHTAASYGD